MALLGTELNRQEVTALSVQSGINDITNKINMRLKQKGTGAYASRHEILGILVEEMAEIKNAIRRDDYIGYELYANELLDVAVGALFGYICIRYGYIQPAGK